MYAGSGSILDGMSKNTTLDNDPPDAEYHWRTFHRAITPLRRVRYLSHPLRIALYLLVPATPDARCLQTKGA